MADNAIHVAEVYKSFGDVMALDGVNLEVPTGKVTGLLGPNGAGKTTLVRILTTLLRPDSGEAKVGGLDVVKHPRQIRQVIGLAGQYPAVDEQLTGRENLIMVGQLYHMSRKQAKQRATELLRDFTLEDAADRPIKTYSGGMRRRLDLAASIVNRPQILFLDEPTTGLDPRTRRDMWGSIRDLVEGGTTLLLTTQYLEEADELADRIIVMDHGKDIAVGTADELKARVSHDMLEINVESTEDLKRAQEALKTVNGNETPDIDENTGLITLPVSQGATSMMEAVRALDDADITVTDFAMRRPSLDDVFLALTGQKTDSQKKQE